MIGREAYQNPWLLAHVDRDIFGEATMPPTRHDAMQAFRPYLLSRLESGVRLNHITRHILGLFTGCRGGRRFRRYLSETAHRPDAGIEVFDQALALVDEVDAERELPAHMPD